MTERNWKLSKNKLTEWNWKLSTKKKVTEWNWKLLRDEIIFKNWLNEIENWVQTIWLNEIGNYSGMKKFRKRLTERNWKLSKEKKLTEWNWKLSEKLTEWNWKLSKLEKIDWMKLETTKQLRDELISKKWPNEIENWIKTIWLNEIEH